MSSPEIITRVKVTSNKTIQDIKTKKVKIKKTNKQTNKNKKQMLVNAVVIMMIDKTSVIRLRLMIGIAQMNVSQIKLIPTFFK